MRTIALIALTSVSLLTACREAADDGANRAVANDAATAEAGNAAATAQAEAPLGAPLSGDAAKKLMHDRHEGMEEIGDAVKLVTRELKRDAPDLARVRDGAGTIARLAPQVNGWFPPGTGPEAGKTHAKPEIWQKPEDFAAKRTAFQQAAEAFNAAAQGSDLAAIRAAYGELGKSCKACHDPYRAKDD